MRRYQQLTRFLFLIAMSVTAATGTRHAYADPAVYEPNSDPAVGFNLIEWYNFPSGGDGVWQDAVQQIHDAGFREVSISPVRYVDLTTGHILATSPKGPELSNIEAAVTKAKSLNMRVTLNPFVEMMDPHNVADPNDDEYFASFNGCGWRGCLDFGEGTAKNTQFWSDYQSYHAEVAAIAEAHHVDAMTVGTEYRALYQDSAQNSHWTQVINAVDGIYHGKIGFAANWDTYNDSNITQAIWENPAIDFLGIDAYFGYGADALTAYFKSQNPALSADEAFQMASAAAAASGTNPNQSFIDLMTAAWKHKLESELLPFAAARKGGAGMPIAFTEAGYLPRDLTTVDPQNQLVGGQPIDTGEQIMNFQALINALDGKKGVFPAMDIWQWDIPGSGGSQWNITTSSNSSPDQPNNLLLGNWLSGYAKTGVPEPSTFVLMVIGLIGAVGMFKTAVAAPH
jgi:Glycoside Hydrolase Family 113/PEP-CTERM motif